MEQNCLIDTNCIIDYANGNLPDGAKVYLTDALDGKSCISVINKIELLGFSNSGQGIIELIEVVMIIGLTDVIVEETINVRRSFKMKLPDAIIAATALVLNLKLITRNIADFKMVKGLDLVNPWDR